MELKQALETIVADIRKINHDAPFIDQYITNNFLVPLSYIDQARNYQQRDLPLGQEVSEDLFLKAFKDFILVEKKYENFRFLIKQLFWYEHKRLEGEEPAFLDVYTSRQIIKKYDKLKSEAEKCIIDHYFSNAINEIREILKPKKTVKSS